MPAWRRDGSVHRPRRRRATMQKSVIIQSNGSGKEDLDQLLKDGWEIVSVTPNNGKSYNDFLVILQRP
jgi:hypothetical protein